MAQELEMEEEIFSTVTDEGQMGARLDVYGKPSGCPGLGGWKRDADKGTYWTRVKYPEHRKVLLVSEFAPANTVAIVLDGDRIVSVSV